MKNRIIALFLFFGFFFLFGCAQPSGNYNLTNYTEIITENNGSITNETSIISNTTNLGTGNENENATIENSTNLTNLTESNYVYKGTFTTNDKTLCKVDGKPIIRLFSTTWCQHCTWIKAVYDKVVKEYVAAGKIIAYHWEVDTKDDALTSEAEGSIPAEEYAYFSNGINSGGSIPYYVFGCKYERIGNGFERARSSEELVLEENEFRALIDKIISEQ